MSKKEFVRNVLTAVKNNQKEAKADNWRGRINNWTKC
jgi:hypothetical protein